MGLTEAELEILQRNVRGRSAPQARPKQPISKYRSRRVEVDGEKFDSMKEAKRWGELKLLEFAGAIRDLQRQVHFTLVVGGQDIGDYVADFHYFDRAKGTAVTEDVKGWKTLPLAKWKQRHFAAQFGYEVTEIR